MNSQERIARADERDLWDLTNPQQSTEFGPSDLVVRTVREGTYPTAAKSVFACQIITPVCVEQENENVDLTASSGTQHVYVGNVTDVLPYEGAITIASRVGDRLLMEYYGPTSPP